MGYNVLVWRAPSDHDAIVKAAREEARSRKRRAIPLPHGQSTSEASTTRRNVRRKRPSKDDDSDTTKKKMKTMCGVQTQRRRKSDKR